MIVTDLGDSGKRADALGKLGLSYGVGMVLGPMIGGLIVKHMGYVDMFMGTLVGRDVFMGTLVGRDVFMGTLVGRDVFMGTGFLFDCETSTFCLCKSLSNPFLEPTSTKQ